MELRTLTPDMPALLAEALKGREVEISARGVKVATTFAGCLGNILKVIQDSLSGSRNDCLLRKWHEDFARDLTRWLHLLRPFSHVPTNAILCKDHILFH
jgi:hypothetical protein